jgi:CO/xanthine dehydrogenase FAD-binding subunit
VREFGVQVTATAEPIDDVRGTAAYRLHSLAVMASRTLTWAWQDYAHPHGDSGRRGQGEEG